MTVQHQFKTVKVRFAFILGIMMVPIVPSESKASIPLNEIIEGIKMGVEGVKLGVEIAQTLKPIVAPVVKPIAEEIKETLFQRVSNKYKAWKAKRKARKDLENRYISPGRLAHELEELESSEESEASVQVPSAGWRQVDLDDLSDID